MVSYLNGEQTPLLPTIEVSKTNEKTKSSKMGTFDGVFLPTALNVLSILMFLRFGFIIGQMGILGTILLLVMSYTIDLLTTVSISAISTNGTVKGGGAYYMISRSLGAEFGGSIGLVFFIGQILNSSLNVVGFIEPLLSNFGLEEGLYFRWLPDTYGLQLIYSTVLLAVCTGVALVGSSLVAKVAFWLFIVLTMSTLSIPISTLLVRPFELPEYGSYYSGPAWLTFKENLFPYFTKGAAGSVSDDTETFRNLFGIFFPATAGVFAGASMSGDLRRPSRSIPKGTLWGLLVTFIYYLLVIVSMGTAIPRDLLHKDITVIQTVNVWGFIILLGEFSTCLFSIIMGVVGSATLLQAIADDKILPGLGAFSTKHKHGETFSILFTWALAQVFLFADINQIATFITMAFLMTFIVTNLACFLLKIGSAPNFRPSFRYFNSQTALFGVVACFIAMFIVDGLSASLVMVVLMFLFLLIHYTAPPKTWGDVSQSLIYHQVRKYLLRLKTDNVKYWRPQILLLVDDPRSCWNLMQFCNHLKKGGLYILGHVLVAKSFQDNFKELQKQRDAWIKLRDTTKLKAFVQVATGSSLTWGIRNLFLGSGLGSMKPNITILGFCDLTSNLHRNSQTDSQRKRSSVFSINQQSKIDFRTLPTDICRKEKRISICQWVEIIEDLIVMQGNVAVAKGFSGLMMPVTTKSLEESEKAYIDLYPIQMSSVEILESGKSVLSTNFDTYTLILQLGVILTTVPEWKTTHKLRIIVFVEFQGEVENEQNRLKKLLDSLRIEAEVKILCLSDGSFNTYNILIKGANKDKNFHKIDKLLREDEWWTNLNNAREAVRAVSLDMNKIEQAIALSPGRFERLNLSAGTPTPSYINQLNHQEGKRRYTLSNFQRAGLSLNMRTNTFPSDHTIDADTDHEDESSLTEFESGSSSEGFHHNRHSGGISRSDSFTSVAQQKANKHQSYASMQRKDQRSSDPDYLLPVGKGKGTHHHRNLSSRSSISNLRPNFSSVTMPESEVNEDGDGSNASIYFVQDEQKNISSQAKSGRADPPGGERPVLSRLSSFTKELVDAESMKSPKVRAESNLREVTQFRLDSDEPLESEQGITREELIKELESLTFNDLPAKGQHLILNEMMTQQSNSRTDVIFSTLPAPMIGTHNNEEEAMEYVRNLDIWLNDLPPVLLINSQTVTVTTAL